MRNVFALVLAIALSVSIVDARQGRVSVRVTVSAVPQWVRVVAESEDYARSSAFVVTRKTTWIEWEGVPSGAYTVEADTAHDGRTTAHFFLR